MTDASQPAGSCSAAQRSLQWATNPGKAEGRSHMPLDSIQTLSSFSNRVDKQAKNCLQLWRERIYWWRNLSWLTNAKPLETEVFPGGSDSKASACNAGHPGLIHGLGRSPGEWNGNPLQYSWLENSMDGGDWRATVLGVAKSGHDWVTSTFTFIPSLFSILPLKAVGFLSKNFSVYIEIIMWFLFFSINMVYYIIDFRW